MDLEDATILVTGANGFVGARTCRALADAGAQVRALVRRPGEEPRLDVDGITEVGGDFTDAGDLAVALGAGSQRVDAVVHAAATAGPDLQAAREVNVEGTRNVVARMLDTGVTRLVHVSSVAVYDRVEGDEPVAEDEPLTTDESAVYPVTKAEAEGVVEAGAPHGLRATILRPPAVLGYAPTSTWGAQVPKRFRDGELAFRYGPDARMAWIHVDDLAEAIVRSLRDDHTAGATTNVVADNATWGRYFSRLDEWFPDAGSPYADDASDAHPGHATARQEQVLSWRPTRGFDDAMAETEPHLREL